MGTERFSSRLKSPKKLEVDPQMAAKSFALKVKRET